jgi:hypothetical protein
MKILFLDIDGVLNSKVFYEANSQEIRGESSLFWRSVAELDPEACALVNQLCEEEDLKIVISSTWRKLHKVHEIEAMFHKRGLFAEVIGITPDLRGNWRGKEVDLFIKEHPELQIEKYVIVDDNSDFDAGKPFVRTEWSIGIQPENIDQIKEVLHGQLVSA